MFRTLADTAISNLGPREILARASDESVGRDGLIIRTAGIDLANFRTNPVVLAGHDYMRPVGRCTSVRVSGSALVCRIAFAPEGLSVDADETCALTKAGILNALSIGFDPVEYGYPDRNGVREITRCDLLEISIVAVPALASALVLERGHSPRAGIAARPPASPPLIFATAENYLSAWRQHVAGFGVGIPIDSGQCQRRTQVEVMEMTLAVEREASRGVLPTRIVWR